MTRERLVEIAAEMGQIEVEAWDLVWSIAEECSEILRVLAPGRRRLFLAHVVQTLYEEQDGMCPLCGEAMEPSSFHRDHRIPFRWGGGHERGNLQLVHPRCNQQKSDDVDLRELIPYLEDRYLNLGVFPSP